MNFVVLLDFGQICNFCVIQAFLSNLGNCGKFQRFLWNFGDYKQGRVISEILGNFSNFVHFRAAIREIFAQFRQFFQNISHGNDKIVHLHTDRVCLFFIHYIISS